MPDPIETFHLHKRYMWWRSRGGSRRRTISFCAGDQKEMTAKLAANTTRLGSRHTFQVIRLLADRGCRDDAFRAYAYFRWLDDWIDSEGRTALERGRFVERQQDLLEGCFAGSFPVKADGHEAMLADLIQHNPDPQSGLGLYLRNMMAVMAFDAGRRGRIISQAELDNYQHSLAAGVTEAMHYFVGRGLTAPTVPERYDAVTAAHITHMLRDSRDDMRAGYFNIPGEYLRARSISPLDLDSTPYREWVQARVELARGLFESGRGYLREVQCKRCRLAAHAYIARFEAVLDQIEFDRFMLRPAYGMKVSPASIFSIFGALLLHSGRAEGRPAAHRSPIADRLQGQI